jgi:hypothetical protein
MSAETSVTKTIHWNSRLEEFFAEAGEKALCYTWCHKQAETLYSNRTVWIDIPVICLSTITGSVSVGSQSLFGDNAIAPVVIGGVVLLTSIMTTVSSYFAWARRAESHKQAGLAWAKLYRFLSVELALPREERLSPTDMLKFVRTEYDQLMEKSPLLPRPVINVFREKFKDNQETIAFPEETNGLHSISVYSIATATPPAGAIPHVTSAFPVSEAIAIDIPATNP